MSDNESKIDNYKFLKKWYNRIKQNLTMILLIPTFIGGLWQVFSLLGLGFEYIRFFSVKQLVADGLLMIILIPLYAIFPLMAYYLIKEISSDLVKHNSKTPFFKKAVLFILTFVLILFFTYHFFKYINFRPSIKPNINIIVLAFLLYIPLIKINATLGSIVSDYINNFIKNSTEKARVTKFQKICLFLVDKLYSIISFAYIPIIVYAGFSCLITFFLVLNLLGDFYVSENLVNLKNVENVANKNYELLPEDYIIKYFNDSYIFLEYETVTSEEKEKLTKAGKTIPTEVLILEFKSLFEK